MSNKKFIVIGIIVAVVCFTLGFVIAQMSKIGISLGENTFQAGWDAAKQRLADSGFGGATTGMEIKNITGEIQSLNGNIIDLKIHPLEPLADPKLDSRSVAVNSDTKIYELDPKDSVTYQKEMDVYNKKLQEQTKNPSAEFQPLVFPEFFIKKEIQLSDLKVGQQIMVATNKDVKDVQAFNAIEIDLPFVPALSPVAPVAPLAPIAPTE